MLIERIKGAGNALGKPVRDWLNRTLDGIDFRHCFSSKEKAEAFVCRQPPGSTFEIETNELDREFSS